MTTATKRTKPEDRVYTKDVQQILKRLVRPDDPDAGDSVSLIAEKANTSTRTIYRILAATTPTISLDLADRVCLAADAHVSDCRLVDYEGNVVPY